MSYYRERDRQDRGFYRERPERRVSIMVRNLPKSISPDDLKYYAEKYGPVKDVYLPKDFYTGEARGLGFVEFQDERDAADAVRGLDGMMLGGREINSNYALQGRKRPDDFRRGGGGSGGGGGGYGRDRDRGGYGDRRGGYGGDRDRYGGDRDRGYEYRERERERDRGRDRSRGRSRSASRSRSRSDRGRSAARDRSPSRSVSRGRDKSRSRSRSNRARSASPARHERSAMMVAGKRAAVAVAAAAQLRKGRPHRRAHQHTEQRVLQAASEDQMGNSCCLG
ncbi:hypothetical protein COO60DRAFT_1627634 [Scenedesmus sp. NREL 46B-D3]|nr:hypothetical protein COO60DRAFT_1627634 [Scenedesmus sp. NREL 46B-D3]